MSDNFWYGVMAGESQARANAAAGDFAETVSSSFRNLGRQQQADLQTELLAARQGAALGRAALTGVSDAVQLLSPSARAEFEAAMKQAFEAGFLRAAQKLDLPIEAGSPRIAGSLRSILKR